MNRKFFLLIVVLVIVLFLSGCNGLPKTAQLSISSDPNPISYDSTDEDWPYTLIITESNGVGATITGLIFDYYDEEGVFEDTQSVDLETISQWFKTNYISKFSTIQSNLAHTNGTEDHYAIVTLSATDDNGNSVETSLRIDYLFE